MKLDQSVDTRGLGYREVGDRARLAAQSSTVEKVIAKPAPVNLGPINMTPHRSSINVATLRRHLDAISALSNSMTEEDRQKVAVSLGFVERARQRWPE